MCRARSMHLVHSSLKQNELGPRERDAQGAVGTVREEIINLVQWDMDKRGFTQQEGILSGA